MAEEELNEELFYRSMRLQRQLAQMGMRYEKLHGGVRGQNRTLVLLSKNEGMKQVELARFARVRPSSISKVVDRLERYGLIERRRDNSDHRVFRFYLTEKGREQNKRNHSSWLGFVGDLMSPLSDDEKAEYLNILKKPDKQALFLEERMEEDAKKEGENHA